MDIVSALKEWLGIGIEPKDFTMLQVCLRGAVVFFAALIIVRVGHKRFLSKMTAFDAVLGFMLASALARAINGSAPLAPTLGMSLLLVMLHRLLSALSFHSARFGALIKGNPEVLVENGKPSGSAMRRHKISEHDLLEEARLNGKVSRLEQIQTATLERSGEVSIITAK